MLFAQTTVALLSVASVALASAGHDQPAAGHANLAKRASVAQEIKELDTLPKQNKKQANAIKAEAKNLVKVAAAVEKKVAQVAVASKANNKASASVEQAAATVEAQVSSAKASLAAFTSSAAASLATAAASVSSAASSVSVKSSSAASSIASKSSASAAAASSSAAAAAKGGCYPIGSFTSLATSSETDVAACADFCGSSYAYVALLEPDSPPATCYCPDIDSLSDIKASSTPAKCNAAYGSTDGTYVSVVKV